MGFFYSGGKMKYYIITLGCKVNTYESAMISEKMHQADFYQVDNEQEADIVIINTCSVTNNADHKSLKNVRHIIKNNPQALIVVCGCAVQNNPEIYKKLPVHIIIGNQDKSKIVDLIKEYQVYYQPVIKLYDMQKVCFENMLVDKYEHQTRAFVKIQDGCDNYCTYCVIPYLRGQIRYKELDVAVKEIKDLVHNGHQEIVLTGIHTGSYGRGQDFNLVTLINEISSIKNLKRIRLSSIEITEITDDFLDILKTNDKLCHHLHIPLQAGSDNVLKLMGRKYDLKYYEEKINEIRQKSPDISITTDVIVGFPGETQKDFDVTKAFVKKIKFSKIHVFPYSIRKNTAASFMPNHLSESEKKLRSKELIDISEQLEKEYYKSFIKQVVNVLIETNNQNEAIGFTSNYLKVIVKEQLEKNTFYNIKIIGLENKMLVGKVEII